MTMANGTAYLQFWDMTSYTLGYTFLGLFFSDLGPRPLASGYFWNHLLFFTWILLFRPHKKTVNSLIYRGYSYNLLCSLRKVWGLNFKRLIAKDSWYTKPRKAFVLNHANCVMLNQSGAPNEYIVQNHLNIESLNVF